MFPVQCVLFMLPLSNGDKKSPKILIFIMFFVVTDRQSNHNYLHAKSISYLTKYFIILLYYNISD